MKILSIGPMPDNTGFMELLNEDGTLFGFAFEPSKEHRKAMEAWLIPQEPKANHLHWGQPMTYDSPTVLNAPQVMFAPYWRVTGLSDIADAWAEKVLLRG